MCCFSQPVQNVSNTRIFARRFDSDRQYLAYSMQFMTSRPNAMILPLPVAVPTGINAVRFISLKEYITFFDDIDEQFVATPRSIAAVAGVGAAESTLPVVEVGDFVASFVPTMRDFSRLDSRFTIKPAVWKRLPRYADYGFAVFQLKAPLRTMTDVHPMALEFRTRLKDKLFFPTVHIHDGKVHSREEYDHQLYWQGREEGAWANDIRIIKFNPRFGVWSRPQVSTLRSFDVTIPGNVPKVAPANRERPSAGADAEPLVLINGIESRHQPVPRNTTLFAPESVDIKRAKGIYSPTMAIHRWTIREVRKNEDILI